VSVIVLVNKPAITPLPASLAGFTPMELNQRLTLHEAAELNKFKDTESFEENYKYLVKQEVHDALRRVGAAAAATGLGA